MATIAGSRPAAPVPDVADVMAMDIGTSHPFTCNTCQVAFRNSDLQKGHMRGDWHRYNLKRRVASLPPLSSEIFTEKVLQARAVTTAQADKAGFERGCEACQKSFYSENSYRNHIGSSKHKARVAAVQSRSKGRKVDDEVSSVMSSTFSLGEPADGKTSSEVDSEAEEEFNEVVESLKKTGLADRKSPVKRPSNPQLAAAASNQKEQLPAAPTMTNDDEASASVTPTAPTPTGDKAAEPESSVKQCLFCNYESPSSALNATHMERMHGMFIPEKQYLVDLDGLLGALKQRIFELNECLTCGKVKANTFAVQTHMRDTAHCKIPYTTEDEQLEIGEFYDFRSTYSDDGEWEDESDDETEDGKQQNGGAKLGAKRPTTVTDVDGDAAMADEDGWETDSSESSLDSDDLHAVPAEKHYHQYERLDKHPHHSRDGARSHLQADGWHAHGNKRAHAVYYDDYELHLPSGKSIGHRSLNRYFRQNLHSHPSPEERQERLAIEAAERENEMDVDSDGNERRVARRDGSRGRTHGRALVTRDARGLGVNGATDLNSREVKRVIAKGRKTEFKGQKWRDYDTSRQIFKQRHRNHASFED